MLTGMHIAVIGGDARQLEIIRQLTDHDAKLSLIGFEELDHAFTGATKEKIDEINLSVQYALILPVHGTDHEGQVNTSFSSEKIILTKEMLGKLPSHAIIFSGISNSYLDGIIKDINRRHVKLFDRDDVAIYNSIPTAEGTIMIVIQHTDVTIHGSHIAVLGFGRVGVTVARTFQALGAKVKVGVRKSQHKARITEMGLTPFQLDDLEENVKDIDICINTIPAPIVKASVISRMPIHTLIIDLASKPGGTDFRYAERRGIKALLAPSLPGIVAPKTAGKILGNVLIKLLKEDMNKREKKQ